MIPLGTKQILEKMLLVHEGKKRHPYSDRTGKDLVCPDGGFVTLGCGRNLDARPLTDIEINYLLNNDVLYFISELEKIFPWFDSLCAPRQCALIDLTFDIGVLGIKKFTGMVDAITSKDWARASNEILNSKYAEEVGQRAHDLAYLLLNGAFNKESPWVS